MQYTSVSRNKDYLGPGTSNTKLLNSDQTLTRVIPWKRKLRFVHNSMRRSSLSEEGLREEGTLMTKIRAISCEPLVYSFLLS